MKKQFPITNLPLKQIQWENLISLLGEANASLARYDGRLQSIPNPGILLSPLMTQEAVVSSKIEGTQATLEEVLEFEADPNEKAEKYNDIEEVINYRKALSFAETDLKRRPLCINILKDIHHILLEGVRGQNKARGEFRRTQNWIGKPGSPIEEASYIPPSPEKMMDSLYNLENYFYYEEKDKLLQTAIIHAQFEAIHPFLDGNGRIGRILIPLFLFDKKVLSSPMFYISSFFEETRDEYYRRLMAISQDGDWQGWITYFLRGVITQAKKNSEKAKNIMDLYDEMKIEISELTNSRFSIQTLDFLFNKPIFKSSFFVSSSNIQKASCARILKCLEKGNVVQVMRQAKGRRAAIYTFNRLLKIV